MSNFLQYILVIGITTRVQDYAPNADRVRSLSGQFFYIHGLGRKQISKLARKNRLNVIRSKRKRLCDGNNGSLVY